ncbi:Uncharacterised protein (plasmid) [Tsukamurella tyrosinosolvens]|uniref:Antitoxin VbhA domain-containing protein n=1 Tax=Tsukamurella tyrosinosolvens TaxID=57704 RepID=A0A1H4TSC2_TSUTY|nr:hypothetical protein [Tsukamurella tyrosinosolvens]AUN40664.1 hypothetical protein ASU32_12120 [Tsukamurella tyrosinosolvens]KXO93111.1 hypothetical protein AXK58_14720 [Tsukamurella tyrosinosolvens]MEC4613246.1 hypothetical protein [Tsukamurella tyrosinosolvens]RDB49762.1 hypothetical protein DVB87_01235 [Tsukamurella tyrosinosolvens]SEC59382.1 hypothetical protein SAMN04489793_2685 [Tsukamurella tyrosinosolvens]
MNSAPLPWWLADSADLLAHLSAEQQDRISSVIYSNYLAGAEPPYRHFIAPLVDVELGLMTADEAINRFAYYRQAQIDE